ncbi:hypothetical protein CXZ10_17400 [Pleomorphomonas diazotrophica]|uniref:Nucleotidyl transferase AbiEii/AbiGii toxin family protein n=1 Tax=Pleomorphomonas diazotrophica TaxID=1166257 RepID=A0A1I4W674_9HYPH|nr:hypothetical protein [Pleomorphomonas diazotrophica]PKR87901.1 hypothetical protein CXZ10_17400 [Pleomorphomonas diazotrophica]SFN08932.1 hypothetical protein SAMN05192571_11555 [Pleomorphomonas diazotrophica]
MVTGIDRFRTHFAGHEHQYVLIGGAACELIMGEIGLDFRATKDLDIVLIVEALDPAFAECFWSFIEEGEYEIKEKSEGGKILYRFQKPKAQGFPAMLKLFSRSPEGLILADGSHLTPLPIDDTAASLSAILLDEDYYNFLKSMVSAAAGIPVLNAAAIIPFKALAWLDLRRKRDAGSQVDERNIKKHRNDVARLLQLLSLEASYDLPETVAKDLLAFVELATAEADYDPRQFNVSMTRQDVAKRLRAAYNL